VNVRVLTRQLRQWGMLVATAESGQAALEVMEQGGHPDLVITDMHMPGMDGVELARRLRDLPGGPRLPLVLLSSGFLPGSGSGQSLFNVRLLKPARQSQLFDALVRCLSGETAPAARQQRTEARKGRTVLVVDDNLVNVKVACGILDRLGYDHASATDGREAVQAVTESTGSGRRFDAVLMDIHMPVMDGLEATKVILQQFGDQAPPIIALTADASIEDRERCVAAGMQGYLTKPLQIAELTRTLELFTAGAPAAVPSPPVAVSLPVAAATTEPALDPARLEEFREYDPELDTVREVVGLFLADLPQRVEQLGQAHAAADPKALATAAHALKGSAANVGAEQLAAWADAVEREAATGRLPADLASHMQQLQAHERDARAALEDWLDQAGQAPGA
ncbi:MAG: response regulator, partial [Comamonadaceae bacterium]